MVIARFVAKLRQNGLLKTFHSWIDFLDWRARGKEIVGRCLQKMTHLKVQQAMRTWRQALVIMLKERHDEEV